MSTINVAPILYKAESFQIMGACFEVHNVMGTGFVEPVYQECLALELALRGIPFVAKEPLVITYKDTQLVQKYIPDFLCFEQIIIEIKSATELCDDHCAQLHNYLHATGHKLGILVNFGAHPKLEYERIAK
jgi:GxxExxY protein